jgi:hypothetical protein
MIASREAMVVSAEEMIASREAMVVSAEEMIVSREAMLVSAELPGLFGIRPPLFRDSADTHDAGGRSPVQDEDSTRVRVCVRIRAYLARGSHDRLPVAHVGISPNRRLVMRPSYVMTSGVAAAWLAVVSACSHEQPPPSATTTSAMMMGPP